MNNTILLVDGHNLLFKAFYGIPARISAKGIPIHGIIGFIGILKKIITQIQPTHLLVVFDSEDNLSRKQDFKDYKANRKSFQDLPADKNPFSQLAGIKTALSHLLLVYVEPPGYEADDIIASYACQFNSNIIIASSDSDFFQLIDNRIKVYRYHGKKSILFDMDMVLKKYGVQPMQFLDFKSLIGDAADNICGIRGVGPKTAVKIINGERALSLMEEAQFQRNKVLIRLNSSVVLEKTLCDLQIVKDINNIKIGEFLQNLQLI